MVIIFVLEKLSYILARVEKTHFSNNRKGLALGMFIDVFSLK